jgi:hypothetical protein
MGMKPGPRAWYHALSNLNRALLLGFAFAIPTAVILILGVRLMVGLGGP